MPFPDSFATPRLCAERLTADHLADLIRMHRDPVQMATLGGVKDDAATAAYLDRNLAHWTDYGFGLWILRDDAHHVAGRALLRHLVIDDRDDVEVGYSFHPEYWGRGLATEIATACVRHGFDDLGLSSIVAITLPTNLASQRVLTKAGLVYECDVQHGGSAHVLFRTKTSVIGNR